MSRLHKTSLSSGHIACLIGLVDYHLGCIEAELLKPQPSTVIKYLTSERKKYKAVKTALAKAIG